jgi:hypothetical protein
MAAVPPGVPPVVQAAVAAAQEAACRQEVLFLLARCGIDAVNAERCFCGVEGFRRPEDFALMTIDEVPKLAKRMAAQSGDIQMHLGTVLQRRLEGLVHWIRDLKRRDKAVNVNEFTNQVMVQAVADAEALRLSRKQAEKKKLTVAEFKGPENWVASHISFCNKIRSVMGANDMPLDCVIREDLAPGHVHKDEEERHKYEVKLEGPIYRLDNKSVWAELEDWLVKTEAHTFIKPFKAAQDGRGAILALRLPRQIQTSAFGQLLNLMDSSATR